MLSNLSLSLQTHASHEFHKRHERHKLSSNVEFVSKVEKSKFYQVVYFLLFLS